MKKLLAIAICLGLLGACGGPVAPEEPTAAISPGISWDAPEAYWPVLDELYQLAKYGYSDTAESYVVEPWFFEPEDLGYAVADINNDGVPELVLLAMNYLSATDEPFILSLFTLADGSPVHLAYYWRRERARLTANGTVYVVSGLGGSWTGLRSYRLDANAAELTRLTEYSRESNNFYGRSRYSGEVIAEEEFNMLCALYSAPVNPMSFNFIPIGQ